jgi:hypothetical protein
MQLTPSFILLLGSLFAIALDTYAIPLTRQQTGIVTLPLKRATTRHDLHPQMVSTTLQSKLDLSSCKQTAPPNASCSLPETPRPYDRSQAAFCRSASRSTHGP